MDIHEKVVIITGASEGIGLATARLFARNGAKVVLVARTAETLQRIANELREQHQEAMAVPADMRNNADVESMINEVYQRYGRLDMLINNAGQSVVGSVAEVDTSLFHHIIELNIFGPLYALQAAVPKMRQTGGGLIINISSGVTKVRIPGIGAYAATKAALNMLSDTARIELAADNIRVITVYPGKTTTDFDQHTLGNPKVFQAREMPRGMQLESAEQVAEKILEAAQKEPLGLGSDDWQALNNVQEP